MQAFTDASLTGRLGHKGDAGIVFCPAVGAEHMLIHDRLGGWYGGIGISHFGSDNHASLYDDIRPDSLVSLRLLFAAEAAYRVYDEVDERTVHPNEDGTFTVTIELPNDAWLYGFLLSFGTSVKVMEPQHVRDYLLSMADGIKNFYKDDIR